ncbi:hypothetical protein SERLA73DRAFT_68986 [Serpula lacrymans var. lacrymans S7.3]|uniref:DNA (cytosine-5-)-methyltransferase n=2 Tax=Serpula lacrymans var. lacrymans TaxID=341189 RepID=F8PG37_SERL3|nr:uncharacterized protein SERLADRAFT_432870 [Serpula lacrymans var. lacrymans S7.9]EGO05372.1 hypothetical protein SERLA73DRAFT_68986 [Serpula lacrymans var. lacrymans S7.3]EGO31222.1 hypothetical protein SERLADRAFT_432870 [Serpula lacrymans var. lacrymans S7.9]
MPPRRRPTAYEISFPDEAQDGSGTDTSGTQSGRKRSLDGLSDQSVRGSKRRSLGSSRPLAVSHYHHQPNEIRETKDFVVFGEDPDEDDDGSKPVRSLSDFSIFDPNHDNEMVLLTALEEDDGVIDRHFEGAGIVAPIFENDEDEGQEDGLEEELEPQLILLGAILRYDFDFTKRDDPVYIETEHSWYQLKDPSRKYLRYLRSFLGSRRIVQLVISSALKEPNRVYKDFLQEFLTLDILGHPLEEKDLWAAVPDLSLALETIENPDRIAESPLIQHLQRKAPTALPRRAGPAATRIARPSFPKRPLHKLNGNLDLAVLRTENQNPTHVTPLIAQMATGYFKEHLIVIGPRPKPLSEAPTYDPLLRMRRFIERAAVEERPVHIQPEQRLKPRSRWLRCVQIGGVNYSLGDVVVVAIGQYENKKAPELPHPKDIPPKAHLADFFWFAKIIYLDGEHETMHVLWFEHSTKTVLQEISDPQELFLTDICNSLAFSLIVGKVTVHFPDPLTKLPTFKPQDFYCRLVYDCKTASFTDINARQASLAVNSAPPDNCPGCLLVEHRDQELYGKKITNGVAWHGVSYHINDFVLIKAKEGPCHVGHLTSISFPTRLRESDEPSVKVKLFGRMDKLGLRPHNIIKDERHLFATDDEMEVVLSDLLGLCFVYPHNSLPDPRAWLLAAPNHFFVRYHFPSLDVRSWNQRRDMEPHELLICKTCVQENLDKHNTLKEFMSNARRRPLRAFDPFGGSGAFGLGLEESGCIKVTHAVEISPSAARTMKRNCPDTTVYNQCANKILQWAIKKHEGLPVDRLKTIDNNKNLPPPLRPGDIDCIVAGFPCQPHSRLNMYQKANDLKSNLILNVLSWIDFLQPRYCIFENVRGFLQYNLKAHQVDEHKVAGGIEMGGLKFVMRVMIAMGYQVRVGLLQAAHYGTPQTRVRFFLVASKHGYPLPELPQPSHDFPLVDSLEIKFPNGHYVRPIKFMNGTAPHSYVSIDDAIHDLPLFDWSNPDRAGRSRQDPETRDDIKQVKCDKQKAWCGLRGQAVYRHEPRTAFQLWCRRKPTEDLQQYTRTYLPIKVKRVRSIPLKAKADYRDMPSALWEWQTANPGSAMARSGFRPGLYGRLDRSLWFQTTVTNVDPTAKQCRVLNPYCMRIVTVRELARSQGFPDYFTFYADGDNVITMHRQIGNAVPWPVSLALGRELRSALIKKWEADREGAMVMD